MDADFWLQRWNQGQTGFHQARVMPLLEKHWPALALPVGSQVFVPLAGKSLDMPWLAAQGHRVLGIELSPLAVQQFFTEHGLQPQVHESRYGVHHVAGNIELICGDVFALDANALAGCAAVYDRAALIALPEPMRERYVSQVYGAMPAGAQGLLITLEYPQAQKAGPPFSVVPIEVDALFADRWQVDALERRDILSYEPRFAAAGVTSLETAVYRLQRDL
ncbi:thiopurine S-methyltransferase [Pseudoxanthomonas sp.]|uniref:thiopurine S-methyltransferase n=1 Tax=Pseudoxanthomonas sp. TaxID=1871049 RepID=UPI0026229C40|nr:thiopurine S-methyltransferase [Pseudoxanthomonas sp.]WDS37313.1 MAG: thiopurine S-methyltransferase [Pseudoxanthomonas sp.]